MRRELDPKRDLVLRRVVIGGSAAPRAMSEKFATKFGAYVVHAWGMTEMSPLGTVCNLLPKHRGFDLARPTRRAGEAGSSDVRRRDEDQRRRGPRGCRTTARRSATCSCAGRGSRAAISRETAVRFSTPTAFSIRATSRRSTPTATCRSPTGRRTSSNRAANGSRRSKSRTRRSAMPRWRRPR